jgi:hypothetical protein
MRVAAFATSIFPILLAACASELSNPLIVGFSADPGQYEFHSCEQIAVQRKSLSDRLRDLKLLMDRAEKGAGGTVVSVIAYQPDYLAIQDQLKVIDATARKKNCGTSENWGSNSAIR